jgi:hypothetical protein
VSVLPSNSKHVSFLSQDFGEIFTSTDGVASEATYYIAGLVNQYASRPRFAVDSSNPSRIWGVDHGTAGDSLYFGYSQDGGSTADYMTPVGNSYDLSEPSLWGVAYNGGTLLAVGENGQIFGSRDGVNVTATPATAALASVKWLSVSMASASSAMIGGAGGKLAKTANANVLPDVEPPDFTVWGPLGNPVAGEPTNYELRDVVDPGGSGLNLASVRWSASDGTSATGTPTSITFPNPGEVTVTVTASDNAGNVSTATFTENVVAPDPPQFEGPPVDQPPVDPPPPAKPKATKTKSASVTGGKVTVSAPNSPSVCVARNKSFTVKVKFAKAKKKPKGARVTKITRADFYLDGKRKKIDKKSAFSQKLKVSKPKAGSTHKIKIKVYLKMSKGKAKTKTISTTVTFCK